MISPNESDDCQFVPKRCNQSLKANPFETYRDPVTGRWITVMPEAIAASPRFEPVPLEPIRLEPVRLNTAQDVDGARGEGLRAGLPQPSPISSRFQHIWHLYRLKFQRSYLQQIQQAALLELHTHSQCSTKSSPDLGRFQWSQQER